MNRSEDQMILQKVLTANRLSYKFFKQEADLRMEGENKVPVAIIVNF